MSSKMTTADTYEREVRKRAVEYSQTCDGVASSPLPLDLILRGGRFIPSPRPVFARHEDMCHEAETIAIRLMQKPPCDVLSAVDHEYLRTSCFTYNGKVFKTTRYAVSSPQADLHTLVAMTLELRIAVLLRDLLATTPSSSFEPTHIFTFNGLLLNPNDFVWPDGCDWPSDPFRIFQDDLLYIENDWHTKGPYWWKPEYRPRLTWNHELRIDASQGSPIKFVFKEDMNIEYRERDGAIRAVDQYAILIDETKVSLCEKKG